jgi:hypothetical protein
MGAQHPRVQWFGRRRGGAAGTRSCSRTSAGRGYLDRIVGGLR